jgi:hypothetical protein
MWTARFGRGFGPVVRQTTKLILYTQFIIYEYINVPYNRPKCQDGVRSISLLFLYLGTRRGWVVSTIRAYYITLVFYITKIWWISQRRKNPLVLRLHFYRMPKIDQSLKNLFSKAILGFFKVCDII